MNSTGFSVIKDWELAFPDVSPDDYDMYNGSRGSRTFFPCDWDQHSFAPHWTLGSNVASAIKMKSLRNKRTNPQSRSVLQERQPTNFRICPEINRRVQQFALDVIAQEIS